MLEYDLRHARSPVVAVTSSADSPLARSLADVLQNQDEVNQVSLAYGCIQKQQQQRPQNSRRKNSKKGGNKSKAKKTASETTSDAALDSESLYLAACDDAGKVRFTTVGGHGEIDASSTILHHDVNGVAVVPCCSFRPGSNHFNSSKKRRRPPSLQLVSGGTDCKIHFWDLARPK